MADEKPKVDSFALASRIGERLEEMECSAHGYADSFILEDTKIDGTFNLIRLAEALLEDFIVEVR